MLTDLPGRVDELARMAVLIDAGDFPGLVALQEQATVLASDLSGHDMDGVVEMARQIGALADAIVSKKAASAEAAFREIGVVIDRLQTQVGDLQWTSDGANAAQPSAAESAADSELIAAWIVDCEGALADLEGRLLALERAPNDREVLAEIRRRLHTLKGECGVLSLHSAQKLCHEAESMIDARIEARLTVPIDTLLSLADWLKAYVSRLSVDRLAQPADWAPLLDALVAARTAPVSGPQVAPLNDAGSAVVTRAAPPAAPSPERTARVAAAAPAGPASDAAPMSFAVLEGTEENLPDFLCEAKDHIAGSEEALLALEHDRGNSELINTVFRAFHTIKGVSGFMALQPIVTLAHSAEQLLDGARSGTLSLGRGELDLVLSSCDMMTRLIGVLEGGKGPTHADFKALVRALDAAALPPASRSAASAPSQNAAPVGAVAVDTPPCSAAAPAPASAAPQSAPADESDTRGAQKSRKTDQTVKVNTTRMDNLVTMVGELVIAQQMVTQDSLALGTNGQRIQRTLSHMGKMIRDLQEVSMSLRMVNLKSTFQKMIRLARDVSQKAGKQIEVVTDGEDVELDRNVVEAITDPLVHMIRNACDHGVEGTQERRAAGKPPVGRVSLRAYHAGGAIVIEIADDGRGLRREKLLAKAKAKGLVAPDADEAAMPDSEVFGLIFLPGFSMAERVTDISGRGVGMDVVRRNIEALRGKIEIRSTPGQGTTFLMRLPLTMAIIDGMVVRVGTQRYVLPTLSIQQSFRPRAEDLKSALGVGEMVRVRGSMLPIHRLNRVLKLHEGTDEITDALLIVMEADDSRFCLLVDEILGQQQVVIKSLSQAGQRLKGVAGGAILGDGRVALILDVAQVVALARDGTESPRRVAGDVGVLSAVA